MAFLFSWSGGDKVEAKPIPVLFFELRPPKRTAGIAARNHRVM
jgi:hypothetical protein